VVSTAVAILLQGGRHGAVMGIPIVRRYADTYRSGILNVGIGILI
jgi:hypothetical protein